MYRYKDTKVLLQMQKLMNLIMNAFSPLDKIGDGKAVSLADAKNYRAESKSNLNEIKKGTKSIDQKSKKVHCIILTCFTKQGTMLLNFLMIILQ